MEKEQEEEKRNKKKKSWVCGRGEDAIAKVVCTLVV